MRAVISDPNILTQFHLSVCFRVVAVRPQQSCLPPVPSWDRKGSPKSCVDVGHCKYNQSPNVKSVTWRLPPPTEEEGGQEKEVRRTQLFHF